MTGLCPGYPLYRISNRHELPCSLWPFQVTAQIPVILFWRFALAWKTSLTNLTSVNVDEMVHISVSEQAFVKGFMVFLAVI